MQTALGKFWMALIWLGGFGFLLMWFGYIAMFFHFDATRPIKPDSVKGAVIPQNNHGHIVYLTEREQIQLLSLQRTSIGLALVAGLATYFYKINRKSAKLISHGS